MCCVYTCLFQFIIFSQESTDTQRFPQVQIPIQETWNRFFSFITQTLQHGILRIRRESPSKTLSCTKLQVKEGNKTQFPQA